MSRIGLICESQDVKVTSNSKISLLLDICSHLWPKSPPTRYKISLYTLLARFGFEKLPRSRENRPLLIRVRIFNSCFFRFKGRFGAQIALYPLPHGTYYHFSPPSPPQPLIEAEFHAKTRSDTAYHSRLSVRTKRIFFLALIVLSRPAYHHLTLLHELHSCKRLLVCRWPHLSLESPSTTKSAWRRL